MKSHAAVFEIGRESDAVNYTDTVHISLEGESVREKRHGIC